MSEPNGRPWLEGQIGEFHKRFWNGMGYTDDDKSIQPLIVFKWGDRSNRVFQQRFRLHIEEVQCVRQEK